MLESLLCEGFTSCYGVSPAACLCTGEMEKSRIIELKCATQGTDVDRKLASFQAEVKGENADNKDGYLTDLESLTGSTKAKVQELMGSSHTSDGEL